MKKFFFSLIILLSLANKTEAKDFYAIGVSNYNAANYNTAAQNFEYAIKINPNNVNARYYLAQIYIKQKQIYNAKMQYNRIILLAPNSDAAILSQKGLSLIKQSQLNIKNNANTTSNQIGGNYIQYVLLDGKIRKWQNFPISVYIENTKHKQLAQKAFQQWQSKTKGVVKFNFTTNKNAQISLHFKDKLENSLVRDSYIAGYSKPYYKNGFLNKSEITILTMNPSDNKDLPDDFIFFSTLHEIGHSLGFNGHSPNESDIMASSASDLKEELTNRDINTVKLFYTLDENGLKALNSGQTDLQLQQLQDYVKQFPDKSVGWANLADHYRLKKMYSDAIQNYKKAISIDPVKSELYNLIGITYEQMGDNNNAYKNLKMACDLNKSNEFYIYQFVKCCKTTEQKATAQKYLKDFIKVNPQKANDDKIKSLMP